MKYLIILVVISLSLKGFSMQPSLVKPNDSSVTISHEIQFSWDDIQGTDFYQLEISTTDDFSAHVTHAIYTNDTTINLSVGQYYWRLQAFENGVASSYSTIRFLTIIDVNSFSPVAWYNSDSSLVYDGSSSVELWKDISGNNYNATQTNTTNKPEYVQVSDKLNNHPSLKFDGSDVLITPNLNISTVEILFIGKGKNLQNNFLGIGLGYRVNGPGGSGGMIFLDGDNYQYFNPVQTTNKFQYHNFGFANGNAAESSFIRINKTPLTKGAFASKNGFVTNNLKIGSYTLDGSFAEIIVFDRHLTPIEKEEIEAYLYHKYAPPVNLGPNISRYGFCDTTLYAGKRFESYLWSDGSTADSLIVSESGTYWVETVDIFGFTSRDTVEVKYSKMNYPTSQLYCKNEFIDWQTNLGEHYNYLWSDGSTADSLVINSPGSYHVTVTDTNGCVFQSDTLVFDEDPFTATASLGPDVNLCTGNNLGLSVGANEAVSYLWNTGATTPEIGISSSGTYNVQVQNANGCVAMDTIDVTIIGDAPNIAFDVPAQSCVAAPFDFEDLSTTTDGSSIIAWDWNFGEGSTENVEQGTFAYSADGNYDITLTIETSSGCFNTLSAPIEIKTNPMLTFSTNYICQNQAIEFNGGQLSPQTITDWNWNFNDPASGTNNVATGQNTQHVFASPGDYDVMLIGTDIFGCIDTLVQTKTIAPTPTADFNFNEVCEGSVVNYQNASTVASPATITSYQWTFGDGTNSGQTNPQKPYASQGVYTVGLTATANNGCSDDTTQTIKIHAIPQVNYTLEQACAGIDAQFIDNSFIPNGSVAQVDWSIDGQTPITGFTVGHQFPNAGTYSLEQTVRSAFGCENSAVSSVTIKDYIDADFDFSPNAFVSDYPIVFQSTSTGASQYEWTFGDFANAQQADTSITFDESQIGNTYTVELLVRNIHGCSDSMTIQRTVLERQTDLLISQLFSQEENGYLTIGVQLKNIGTTPINMVDLYLRKPSLSGGIKETWSGNLQAGQSEIYVFSAAPSATVMDKDADQNYLCIEGRIVSPAQFTELDLENNEVCRVIAPSEVVLIHPYPNPVSDQLTIKVVMPAKEVIALHVYNDQGRLVHTVTEEEELQKGLNTFYVNTSGWAAGNYKIRTITSTKQVPTVGFVKL